MASHCAHLSVPQSVATCAAAADELATAISYWAYDGTQAAVFVDMECPSMHSLYAAAVARHPGTLLPVIQPASTPRSIWPLAPPSSANASALPLKVSNSLPEDTVFGPPGARVWLTEYETQDWDSHLALHQAVQKRGKATSAQENNSMPEALQHCELRSSNFFFTRKGLSRKAHLAKHLNAFIAAHPTSPLTTQGWLPQSIVINTLQVFNPPSGALRIDRASALADALWEAEDAVDAAAEHASNNSEQAPLWILKPSIANKGAEVTVLSDMATVASCVCANTDIAEWVLQRYLPRPLLLEGRKFHLRVYVLLTSCMNVYLYREGQVLSAVKPYQPAAHSTQGEAHFAHITNTYLALQHGEYEEGSHLRLMSELPHVLPGGAAAADLLWQRMRACTAHVLASYKGAFGALAPLASGFELFGVDFLVTESLQPHLLEFNPGPDMALNMGRLAVLMHRVAADTIAVAQRDLRTAWGLAAGDKRSRKETLQWHGASTHAAGGVPGGAQVAPVGPLTADRVLRAGGVSADWTLEDGSNGWDCVFSEPWCAPAL